METYIDKNKTFHTNGNQEIDRILYMMEFNGVLSETLKGRIVNLCLRILTNHENHITEINDSIEDLCRDMKWVNIFNDSFIGDIRYYLVRGLEYEKIKSTSNWVSNCIKP